MHHVTMFLCDTSARCFAWHPGPGNDRPNLRVSQLQGGDERWKTLMGGMELNKNTEGWWLLMVFHTLFFFWQSVYLIHVHIIFTWHIRSSHCVPLCFPQDSSLVAGSMSSKTRPDLDFVIWIWPFRFRFGKNLATVDRGPFHPRCRQDTQYEYWSSAARWDTQRTMDGSCYDGPE